jgi:Tol biopolymer transport system component
VPQTEAFISTDNGGNPLNPAPVEPIASQLKSGGGASVSGFVVFRYPATNQVPGPADGSLQIYERDLGLGQAFWVSQDNNGNPARAPWGGMDPSVSSDGRFVTFISSGLATNDTNGAPHLYLRDTCLGVANCTPSTQVVDIATVGPNAGQSSESGIVELHSSHAISANGRYIVFESTSPDVAPNAAKGGAPGVYVRDMSCTATSGCPGGAIHLVSLTTGGTLVFGNWAAISGDGHYVVFLTEQTGYGLPPSGSTQVVLALTGF